MNILNSKINIAIEEAKKSIHKQKIGCVIFNKKKIISKGYNTPSKSIKKLHPKYQRWPNSIHAEVAAIIKAKTDLKGCDILVVRINNDDKFRLAKPCHNCMMYIEHVGIHKIYYSIDSYPYIKEEKV